VTRVEGEKWRARLIGRARIVEWIYDKELERLRCLSELLKSLQDEKMGMAAQLGLINNASGDPGQRLRLFEVGLGRS